MTNREKYAEQILDIACNGGTFALKNEEIVGCDDISCNECEFRCKDGIACEDITKEWANSEYIEKPKISENDKRFLDYLPSEEAWMARDRGGELCLFCKHKPWKSGDAWYNGTRIYTNLNKLLDVDFPMVKWEDEEPWSIEDLKKLEVEK